MGWIEEVVGIFSQGWVGSAIGVAGILAAVVTYLLTRQRILFSYTYSGERVLGLADDGLPDEITVKYRGEEINRLTRSIIVFWNSGEKTISREDLVATDPLRIYLGEDGRVLSSTILKVSRIVTDVRCGQLDEDGVKVGVMFDFLDSGDGAVVEILHTGRNSLADLKGTIRGMPKGARDQGGLRRKSSFKAGVRFAISPKNVGLVSLALGVLVTGVGLFAPNEELDTALSASLRGSYVVTIAGVVYSIIGGVLVYLSRRKYPKSLHLDVID